MTKLLSVPPKWAEANKDRLSVKSIRIFVTDMDPKSDPEMIVGFGKGKQQFYLDIHHPFWWDTHTNHNEMTPTQVDQQIGKVASKHPDWFVTIMLEVNFADSKTDRFALGKSDIIIDPKSSMSLLPFVHHPDEIAAWLVLPAHRFLTGGSKPRAVSGSKPGAVSGSKPGAVSGSKPSGSKPRAKQATPKIERQATPKIERQATPESQDTLKIPGVVFEFDKSRSCNHRSRDPNRYTRKELEAIATRYGVPFKNVTMKQICNRLLNLSTKPATKPKSKTPKEMPKEAPKEAPKEMPKEAPKEMPKEVKEPPKDNSKELLEPREKTFIQKVLAWFRG